MSLKSKAAENASRAVVPHLAAGYVRTVLDLAIDGIGPLRAVAATAGARLAKHGGDVEAAVTATLVNHTALASAQGFVTNLGGIAFAAVTLPANVVGVTLVQCHLVASIAHLRGYNIEDPRVRNAILAVLLGEDSVADRVKNKKRPMRPLALATSPMHDPQLDDRISKEVTGELVGRTVGRRAVMVAGKKVPFLGGAVGASADGYLTWKIGQYAVAELADRRLPAPQQTKR